MDDDWQQKIGELVRETYKQQGFTDVIIAIGAINPDDEINTHICYPRDTSKDFDLRLMWFAINNHFYSDYNDALTDAGLNQPEE